MLNTESFLERLQVLMDNNQLNATAFAEKIGIQRSSVSHILSKRNKPSLEFMLKVHEHFEEANLDWLILGNEKTVSPTPSQSLPEIPKPDPIDFIQKEKVIQEIAPIQEDLGNNDISQIIQLYKDGSFRIYFPKS